MGFIAVYITHATKANAETLCDILLREKYIACANIFPIQSTYWWQSEVMREDEYVSIVKTIPENWKTLQTKVEALHPYEIPCIMKMEVEANSAYEQWIRESVILIPISE